ncbi:MAG: hypothetical protein ACYSWX_00675 [Planctomycetota bacterium]
MSEAGDPRGRAFGRWLVRGALGGGVAGLAAGPYFLGTPGIGLGLLIGIPGGALLASVAAALFVSDS